MKSSSASSATSPSPATSMVTLQIATPSSPPSCRLLLPLGGRPDQSSPLQLREGLLQAVLGGLAMDQHLGLSPIGRIEHQPVPGRFDPPLLLLRRALEVSQIQLS